MADDGAGGELRLVGGVLHRFQPHIGAGLPVAELRHVADGEDVRRRECAAAGRRAMPLPTASPAASASSLLGTDADADDDHAGRDALAGRRHRRRRRRRLRPRGARRWCAVRMRTPDAASRRGDMRGDDRRDGAAEQPVLRLDDGDAAAAGGKRRGDLQPDEAAADARRRPRRVAARSRMARASASERSDSTPPSGPPAMASARGRAPVARMAWSKGMAAPLRSCTRLRGRVDARRRVSPSRQLDGGAAVESLGAQDLRPGVGILDEGLGQRRLVVGQFGLVADQRDAAVDSLPRAGWRRPARRHVPLR